MQGTPFGDLRVFTFSESAYAAILMRQYVCVCVSLSGCEKLL